MTRVDVPIRSLINCLCLSAAWRFGLPESFLGLFVLDTNFFTSSISASFGTSRLAVSMGLIVPDSGFLTSVVSRGSASCNDGILGSAAIISAIFTS